MSLIVPWDRAYLRAKKARQGRSHLNALRRIPSGWAVSSRRGRRRETFKFSIDPELEAKVHDVVGLYLNPPEKAIVLCVDEKAQIQALNRTAPILPLRPGLPEKATHDYKRNGTRFSQEPLVGVSHP